MPKQSFDGKRVTIIIDESDPKDQLELKKGQHKGKNPKILTQKQKAELFDALVDAGEIKL